MWRGDVKGFSASKVYIEPHPSIQLETTRVRGGTYSCRSICECTLVLPLLWLKGLRLPNLVSDKSCLFTILAWQLGLNTTMAMERKPVSGMNMKTLLLSPRTKSETTTAARFYQSIPRI